MAYLAAADFRTATSKWYTADLILSESEADNAALTSAITAMSESFDEFTGDHFEKRSAQTLTLNGDGSRILLVPERINAVTSVSTIDSDGSATLEDAADYRIRSSLDAARARRVGEFDYLEVTPARTLSTGRWPKGTGTVRVVGDFGWTTTPERVKRAVALMVWDHFKARRSELMRAVRYQTGDVAVERALPDEQNPTGIPEVDSIILEFRRGAMQG